MIIWRRVESGSGSHSAAGIQKTPVEGTFGTAVFEKMKSKFTGKLKRTAMIFMYLKQTLVSKIFLIKYI